MAALVGVDVDRTISMTFVIAAALAAVAGTMYLMYYGVVSFADGFVPGVKAFTAAVLGGIGSLPGAVIGGILNRPIETMWSAYFSIDYKDVAAFSVLAITLIFLPARSVWPPGCRESLVASGAPAKARRRGSRFTRCGRYRPATFGLFLPLIGFQTVTDVRNERFSIHDGGFVLLSLPWSASKPPGLLVLQSSRGCRTAR
jgi:hypothetical protein